MKESGGREEAGQKVEVAEEEEEREEREDIA